MYVCMNLIWVFLPEIKVYLLTYLPVFINVLPSYARLIRWARGINIFILPKLSVDIN